MAEQVKHSVLSYTVLIRSDGSIAGPPPSGLKAGTFTNSFKREANNFKTASTKWQIWLLICVLLRQLLLFVRVHYSCCNAFTLRSRSLNGATYWIAQMAGGLIIGLRLDLKYLTRPQRALLGYVFIFVTGFSIWGGGLAFQRWDNTQGGEQWLDFSDAKEFIGPYWLYFFYGAFDAFWQSFCYWLMAAMAETPGEAAKFVMYKTFQATGGAVVWRINALNYPPLTQLAINWGLLGVALLFAIPTVLTIKPTEQYAPEDDTSKSTTEKAGLETA